MAPDATYDVFLSYAARDRPAVEELARQLRAAGFQPFFDKWHLVPGRAWQEELEEALARSRTCAVFLGPGDLGPWQNEEMRGALERRARDQSHSVIPVLLPDASMSMKKALPPALKRLTWVEFRGGLTDPEAFHRLVCGIKGIPPGDGPTPAEPKTPPRAEPPLPVRGSAVRQKKRSSRRFLLLLLTVAIFAGAIAARVWFWFHPTCTPGKETTAAGITWIRICPGTFTMGSPDTDPQAEIDEKPAHRVTLSEFWLGKTEVTNKQYRLFQPNHQGEDELPATNVSWDEAKATCERFGGRLPTEAEWEYAARAGSQTAWSFGADETRLGDYAWYAKNLGNTTHPVCKKKPNDWGLCDMHGNAVEWVADWYGPYSGAAQGDPSGPQPVEARVLRGGSFINGARFLRSAFRFWFRPGFRDWNIGFRCARGLRHQP